MSISTFARRHRWLTIFFILLATLPISYNCIEEPLAFKAPSWQTQLTIPLHNRSYFFSDVISKDSKFDTTGGTILYKPISDEIGFRQGLPQDVFNMPAPKGNTIQKEIGVVPVTVGAISPVVVSASQLGIPVGTIPVFAPELQVPINAVFGDSTVYKYLVFETGQMSLSIFNNFPFAIQFIGDSLLMVNKNDSTQVVAKFVFSGQIAPGATGNSNSINLANIKMDAGLKLKGAMQTIGLPGKTIQASDNITAQLSLSNTSIKSALAKTDNFDGTTVFTVSDSAVSLDDSIKVKLAKFSGGSLKIRIINKVPLRLTVQFKMDELIDNATNKAYALPGTDPVTGFVTIEPRDSLTPVIQMSNMTFTSRLRSIANDTLVTQELHFSLGIKTLSASANYELVNKTDLIIADVQPVPLDTFKLSSVVGKVPPQPINITKDLDAGIGDIGNDLTLTSFTSNINLSARILSTGLFPTNLLLKIYAVDLAGNVGDSILVRNAADIANNRNFHRVVPGVLDIVPITAGDINTLMNSFLATKNQLPEKFLLKGYALINPFEAYLENDPTSVNYTGSIKRNDSVFVSLDYSIPVAIGIKNGSLKDTSSFADNNIDTSQVNLIQSGKIFMSLVNTFPLDIELRMKLLKPDVNDSSKVDTLSPPVLTIPQDLSDPVNYPPIRIAADSTPGRTGVKSFTFINLIPSDAAKLANASFSVIDLRLNTPGNGTVAQQFKKTDNIRFKTFANIIFLVDLDRLK